MKRLIFIFCLFFSAFALNAQYLERDYVIVKEEFWVRDTTFLESVQNQIHNFSDTLTRGNPILENVTTSDTSRWAQGGSTPADSTFGSITVGNPLTGDTTRIYEDGIVINVPNRNTLVSSISLNTFGVGVIDERYIEEEPEAIYTTYVDSRKITFDGFYYAGEVDLMMQSNAYIDYTGRATYNYEGEKTENEFRFGNRFLDSNSPDAYLRNYNNISIRESEMRLSNYYGMYASIDTTGKYTFKDSTYLDKGYAYTPPENSGIYSLIYDANDSADRFTYAKQGNTDTMDITYKTVTAEKIIETETDHAYLYYRVTGNDTIGGSSAGNPIDIVTQYRWVNCRLSTNTWVDEETDGFTYDNDTLQYTGTLDAHILLNAQLSVSGTSGISYEIAWKNVTDNTILPARGLNTMSGATDYVPIGIVAYDKNADLNDRYVLLVRNLSGTQDLTLFDGTIFIDLTHYK